MNKFSGKTQSFFMGLMVGLVIACGFFVLKLDDYFKELNFYKTFIHTFSKETKTPQLAEEKEQIGNEKESTAAKYPVKTKVSSQTDTAETNINESETLADADTVVTNSSKDTLLNDIGSQDDIVVRKDELLSSSAMEVNNLNPVASRNVTKDSLLQRVSGVQDDKNSGKQFFNVEFWQSPLNYRGYKMSKNKIVLYGLSSADGVKVFKIEDNIYIKNSTSVFKLDYASDFRPYERITDESIINKLK